MLTVNSSFVLLSSCASTHTWVCVTKKNCMFFLLLNSSVFFYNTFQYYDFVKYTQNNNFSTEISYDDDASYSSDGINSTALHFVILCCTVVLLSNFSPQYLGVWVMHIVYVCMYKKPSNNSNKTHSINTQNMLMNEW